MRHGKKFNHLGRQKGHREAMLMNMACSLIEHKRINTTVAKAKALRKFVEPLINRSKEDSTHSRRMVFRYLQSKDAVNELFREVAPKIADRPGGYTRILKTGQRLGDAAEMCFIELVDYNENMLKDPKTSKKKRSRRGGKKTTDAPQAAAATESSTTENVEISGSVVEEAVIVEEVKADATEEVVAEVEQVEAEAEAVEDVKEEAVEKPEVVVEEVADAAEEVKEEVETVVEEVAEVEAVVKEVAEEVTEAVAEVEEAVDEVKSETEKTEGSTEEEPESSEDDKGEEDEEKKKD